MCGGEPFGNLLETLLGNVFLGNLAWEPVLGNLGHFLGKGNPFLGTWFPTLRGADLAAPTCSGTFTMAKDHKLTLLGKNNTTNKSMHLSRKVLANGVSDNSHKIRETINNAKTTICYTW